MAGNISDKIIHNRLHESNETTSSPTSPDPDTPCCSSGLVSTLSAMAEATVGHGALQWARSSLATSRRALPCRMCEGHDGYGGGSLMMCGGFQLKRKTPLHRVQGNVTGIGDGDDSLHPSFCRLPQRGHLTHRTSLGCAGATNASQPFTTLWPQPGVPDSAAGAASDPPGD